MNVEVINLDGMQMLDGTAMHIHLQDRMHLPEYYGRNLDALNDCLSERDVPRHVCIWNAEWLDCRAKHIRGLLAVLADNDIAVEVLEGSMKG